MSDSITVRVTLDAYDMASTGRQTQVYVQIPEVARASWLLPSDQFARLKDRAWPEVLDVTHDYVTYGGLASNSSATAAWAAVREWLAKDEHRVEMQAAWERDEARRHPVARKLLAETERLREQLADSEQCSERRRVAWRMAYLRAQGRGWAADRAGSRVESAQESMQHLLFSVIAGQMAVRAARLEAETLRARVAELETVPRTVFRSSYDAEEMGLWATREAARAQCEAHERNDWLGTTTPTFTWVPDDAEDDLSPEELWSSITSDADGSETGYVVTPIRVPAEYDEEADQ